MNIRDRVEKHLTEWFRGMGIETHQIQNSARQIEAIIEQACNEVIGEDEPNIPMGAMSPDGTQIVQINPVNTIKTTQRKRLKQLMGGKP